MTWLFVAIAAYFLNAVTPIIDKYLLGDRIPNPTTYAFYIGLFSVFGIVFAPFGMVWPGATQLAVSLLSGILFLFGLYALYAALKRQEASRVIPVIGGFTPLTVSVLAYFWVGERLDEYQVVAFLLLVAGGVLISLERGATRYAYKGFLTAVTAAVLLGLSYALIKVVFLYQPFFSGFVWTRVGSFLAAFLLLVPRENRRAIFQNARTIGLKTGGLFVFNKFLGGVTYLLLNYAFFLGSVTLVNALQGVQYVFLFLFTLLLSRYTPRILHEELTKPVLVQKSFAILLIVLGLGLLYH